MSVTLSVHIGGSNAQVVFVVCDFAFHEGCTRRFAIVREIEEVDHVGLLLLHGLPAEVNNALEAEGLMVLLPTMSDEDRVRLRKWDELELLDGIRNMFDEYRE